jgi:hypothetical protein
MSKCYVDIAGVTLCVSAFSSSDRREDHRCSHRVDMELSWTASTRILQRLTSCCARRAQTVTDRERLLMILLFPKHLQLPCM